MGTMVLKGLHKGEMSEALEEYLAWLRASGHLSKIDRDGVIGRMMFAVFTQMSTECILKNED